MTAVSDQEQTVTENEPAPPTRPRLPQRMRQMLLGVFIPGQLSLMPWAYLLGKLHLTNTVYALILLHCVQGLSFTTLFCRNFYVNIPDDLIKALDCVLADLVR